MSIFEGVARILATDLFVLGLLPAFPILSLSQARN